MRIAVSGGTGTVGRHVVDSAAKSGHDAIALSPSNGVDVRNEKDLAGALRGVDVVVDVANGDNIEQGPATDFFVSAARALQKVGAERGVGHIVTLSIVGIDKTSFGYYQAKLAQEKAAAEGPVPHTIMRATQMHELTAQLIDITRHDSQARVFDVHVQPVAARTTGQVLVELAEGAPLGRSPDLAGPEDGNLVDMARAFADRFKGAIHVVPDGETMADVPLEALLPDRDARIEGPSFQAWLASDDAAALAD